MSYTRPALNELIAAAKDIKATEYAKADSHQKHLIDFLYDVHLFIEQNDFSDTGFTESDLEKACLGAWIYFREYLAKACWFNPEFTKGYFFNSGDPIYSKSSEKLKLKENKLTDLDDETKLVCLGKFFNLFFKKNILNQSGFTSEPALKKQIDTLPKPITAMLKAQFEKFIPYVNNLPYAVPTETAIDIKSANLYEEYKKKKDEKKPTLYNLYNVFNWPNPNRTFYSQLIEAVTNINIKETDNKKPNNKSSKLSYSERVKLGARFCVMYEISSEWQWHSELFTLLDINHLNSLDHETKIDCIMAFKDFLTENSNLVKIEAYGEKFKEENTLNPINLRANQLRTKMEKAIKKLEQGKTNWPAMMAMSILLADIGAMIAAPIGYGFGEVAGFILSNTDYAQKPKSILGQAISYGGNLLIGTIGNRIGYYVAGLTTERSLGRAFAQVFEQLAKLIGGATGGAIGLSFDVSYKGLRDLCGLFIELRKQIKDPILLKNTNIDLIQCIYDDLPEAMFTDEKKAKTEKILQEFAPDIHIDSQVSRVNKIPSM